MITFNYCLLIKEWGKEGIGNKRNNNYIERGEMIINRKVSFKDKSKRYKDLKDRYYTLHK